MAIPTGPDPHVGNYSPDRPTVSTVEIDIVGPLTLWIILLVMGVVIQLVIIPLNLGGGAVNSLLTNISNWILYLPGSVVIPLVISLMVGEGVGATRSSARSAAYVGEINALYTSLVYIIAIIIIYLIFYFISPASLVNITLLSFAEFSIVIPVVILLVLVPLISAMSAARHSAS